MQDGEVFGVLLQQHGFGDLHLEPRGREAGLGKGAGNRAHQIAALKLNGRQVDREIDVGGPFRPLRAGGAQDPFADRDDQPGVLGDRDEPVGGHEAVGRMFPAYQRLGTADAPRRNVDDRLVMQGELIARQGVAQVQLERSPQPCLGIHLADVELVSLTSFRFRPIKREIGAFEQLHLGRAVAWGERDADAYADDDLVAFDVIGLAQDRLQAGREDDRVVLLVCVGELQDCELVAAEAGHVAILVEATAQALGD